MNEPDYKAEPSYDLRDALKLPILFHAGGPWDAEREAEWLRITGTREASTKVMCDHLRSALAIVTAELQPGSLAETFNELAVGHCLDKLKLEDEVAALLAAKGKAMSAEFKKQEYGAVVATIAETDSQTVEVLATDDGTGTYNLIIHRRRHGSDAWDDLTAYLTADQFEMLGSVARQMPPKVKP